MEPSHCTSPALWFADALVIVRVRALHSQGRLGVWESVESHGDRLPLHVHQREDEQLVLLDGQVTVWIGDHLHHLQPGQTLALPRGVPHAHLITSKKARILSIATPGGFEQIFTDLGVPALPGTAAPLRPDDATLAAAAEALGVQIIGPPPTESI